MSVIIVSHHCQSSLSVIIVIVHCIARTQSPRRHNHTIIITKNQSQHVQHCMTPTDTPFIKNHEDDTFIGTFQIILIHVLNNLRATMRPALERIGRVFAATGLSPNVWTMVGMVLALASAAVYSQSAIENALIIGGVLLLVSGFFDIVDGQVARVTNKTTKRGSYLDSMSDKIAECAIFLGIMIGGYAEPYMVLIAITLSLLVSYARAKSDAIGIKLQGIGIGERAERLLVVAIIGMVGFMDVAVIIVAVIAGITLIQRMIHTAKAIKD